MSYPWSRENLESAIRDVLLVAEDSADYKTQLLDPAFAKAEVAKLIDTTAPEALWDTRTLAFLENDSYLLAFLSIPNLVGELKRFEICGGCSPRGKPNAPLIAPAGE